jgi:hypothetical protein
MSFVKDTTNLFFVKGKSTIKSYNYNLIHILTNYYFLLLIY